MSEISIPSGKFFLNSESGLGVYRIIPVNIKRPIVSLNNIYVAKFGSNVYKLLSKEDYLPDIEGRPELVKLWDETAGALSTLASKDEMMLNNKGNDYIFTSCVSMIHGFVTDYCSDVKSVIPSKIPSTLIFQIKDLEKQWHEFEGTYSENVENLYIPFLRRDKVIQIEYGKNGATRVSLDNLNESEKEKIKNLLCDNVKNKNVAADYLGINTYNENMLFNELRIRLLKSECYKKIKELEENEYSKLGIKMPF